MSTRKFQIIALLAGVLVGLVCICSTERENASRYRLFYEERLQELFDANQEIVKAAEGADISDSTTRASLRRLIAVSRRKLKAADFWTRYLEPTAYKKLNGPLPVEWETEVFEKFEKPYRRTGAGLTLAELYLDEPEVGKDSFCNLIVQAQNALTCYRADTVTRELMRFDHFFLCNRLFLLNLAAIYTTGFECPAQDRIIRELREMMCDTRGIYAQYSEAFPQRTLSEAYITLYDRAIDFVGAQPEDFTRFDHYRFLRDFVNPLFRENAGLMARYGVVSRSLVDFSLNKSETSIFSKSLYHGQNTRGIFTRVRDSAVLAGIAKIGKLLFYDPILSGNNMRSCASCHKPEMAFADTGVPTALAYDRKGFLARNTPSLLNADYNHLIMLDGFHYSLQLQTLAVVTHPKEMGGVEADILRKVMSCDVYRKAFKRLTEFTPQEPVPAFVHIASALTMYYGQFSRNTAPFDDAMNQQGDLPRIAREGFNLFMGKAQCGTCHFVPQFNGVKPPYVGSEFEVLGVPADTGFKKLSPDMGRYLVNPASETLHAFRTGTIRNAGRTAPYMHNGVFRTLREVVDFYDQGGGTGRGLDVRNQTLSADRLNLTEHEKEALIAFMQQLTERNCIDTPPANLPLSSRSSCRKRKVGGVY